ncbi:hypothetical protein KP509_1Z326000 [Ceratopteris richardii]|nr:hypothetical protein KP509_1Z326000 [Ceratopteris richardii]
MILQRSNPKLCIHATRRKLPDWLNLTPATKILPFSRKVAIRDDTVILQHRRASMKRASFEIKRFFLKECIGIRSSRENSSYASGEQINTKRQCSGLKIEPKENSLCVRRIEQGVKSERRSGNMCDLAPSIDLDTAVRMNKFVSKSPEEVCPSINSDLNAEKKSRKNDGDLPTTKSPSGIFVDVTNKFELHAGSGECK